MNMRSLCFARVARERKAPWLWWDFADRLASDCRMAAGKFTADCAQKVRISFAGGGRPRRETKPVSYLAGAMGPF